MEIEGSGAQGHSRLYIELEDSLGDPVSETQQALSENNGNRRKLGFLNDFIEVTFTNFYTHICIYIYLRKLNNVLRHLELCTAKHPIILYY